MTAWGNPLPGRIQASWENWAGVPTFQVTQDYHAGHQALDIGNSRSGVDPVSAMRAGTIVKVDPIQGVVGIDHGDGFRSDYAHMVSMGGMWAGLWVPQGLNLGLVDSARDTATYPTMDPHLHLVILHHGYPQDPWPYLNQPEQLPPEEASVDLKGTNPRPLAEGSQVHIQAGGYLVADCTAMPYTNLVALAPGTPVNVDWQVAGNTILGTDQWYGAWVMTSPPQFGYVSLGLCGPLELPGAPPPSGDAAAWEAWYAARPKSSMETWLEDAPEPSLEP